MRIKLFTLFIVTMILSDYAKSQTGFAWPDNIDDFKTSIGLVEYFQPQFEMGEIQDKSRIKKKITGILVNADGLVMTSDIIYPANLDIVESNLFYLSNQPMPEDITVSFKRDVKLKAKFVGKDEELRIAFIQLIEKDNLPKAITFGKERENNIGDLFYLIQHLGERYDYEKITTIHYINAIIEKPRRKLLTTSNIDPLSAGGLAVDEKGNAMGIIFRSENYYSHYDYEYQGANGVSPLIQIVPAAQFIPLLSDPPRWLNQKEGKGKSWLGVQMQILTKEMAGYWAIEDTHGIILNKIMPGSPAEKAGLEAGDILLSLGQLVINSYDKKNLDVLRGYVRDSQEGEMTAKILRNKQTMEIKVTLESAPKSRFLAEEYSDPVLGLGVKEITQDYIINNDLDFDTEGVWVSRVEDAGAASLGGIDINDLIIKINGYIIKDLTDFEKHTKILKNSDSEYIEIFLRRNNKTRFVFIKLMYGDDT